MRPLTQTKLILYTLLFITLFNNYRFFKNLLEVYPLATNIGFILSLITVMVAIALLLFTLVRSKYTTKPLLIFTLIISSLTGYFMNSYNIIVDDDMIRNLLQTNIDESMDLITLKEILYLIFLGILPSYIVYKSEIKYFNFKEEFYSKLKVIGVSSITIIIAFLLFSAHYTSFLREHKPLRYSVNPTYWIYNIGKYISSSFEQNSKTIKPIGKDATIAETDTLPKLVIMVVGEAVRADHFSLNGYQRKTNPLLEKTSIINFSNFSSCGTSTAISVPCMFSSYGRKEFDYKKGRYSENILDILKRTQKVDILWRDNNSDSKGVALRVPYQSYKTDKINTICDKEECRDEGMLVGLDNYIQEHQQKNILIVLHQMGNHGPAYYRRYPKGYELFKPTCKSNQLESCSKEQITNAYDNSILYTDYFLSQTIQLLEKYNQSHKTAMIYMSDHGESLGENGIYLHGLPYFIAPQAQTHIPALIWLGEESKKVLNITSIQRAKKKPYTHDNLFHTLLALFDVETSIYNEKLNLLPKKD